MDAAPEVYVRNGRLAIRVSLPGVISGDDVVADVLAEPPHLRVRDPHSRYPFRAQHWAAGQAASAVLWFTSSSCGCEPACRTCTSRRGLGEHGRISPLPHPDGPYPELQLQYSMEGCFQTATVPLPPHPLPETAAVKFSRRRRILTFTCACRDLSESDGPSPPRRGEGTREQANDRCAEHRCMSPNAQRQARDLLYGFDELHMLDAARRSCASGSADLNGGVVVSPVAPDPSSVTQPYLRMPGPAAGQPLREDVCLDEPARPCRHAAYDTESEEPVRCLCALCSSAANMPQLWRARRAGRGAHRESVRRLQCTLLRSVGSLCTYCVSMLSHCPEARAGGPPQWRAHGR